MWVSQLNMCKNSIYSQARTQGGFDGFGRTPPGDLDGSLISNCMLILSSILLFTCMIYGIGEMPKRHDNFFLFCWYKHDKASLGGYQFTVKMWIVHSKGHL